MVHRSAVLSVPEVEVGQSADPVGVKVGRRGEKIRVVAVLPDRLVGQAYIFLKSEVSGDFF
ncbi:hypothetical protein DPPLL_10300 [Desulfofustis limnaeus]|uniref:Uncharacterized protein n=1 Tax=Desulfofustis limnaeus TaxID=2740163 RepID=A0ABN6M3E5_9BACT|nr:hypothetical protein DPPLL_10300 [Desulfofustis limnaeus]